jgi:hypothetical protein
MKKNSMPVFVLAQTPLTQSEKVCFVLYWP